jgi:hypothetical protein
LIWAFGTRRCPCTAASERVRDGNDHVEGAGARNDGGLFVERVGDVVDQPGGHAWGLGADQFDESATAGSAQDGLGSVAFQQPGDGPVIEAGPQNALHGTPQAR